MLDHGAKELIHSANSDMWTPLMVACDAGSLETVQVLVSISGRPLLVERAYLASSTTRHLVYLRRQRCRQLVRYVGVSLTPEFALASHRTGPACRSTASVRVRRVSLCTRQASESRFHLAGFLSNRWKQGRTSEPSTARSTPPWTSPPVAKTSSLSAT